MKRHALHSFLLVFVVLWIALPACSFYSDTRSHGDVHSSQGMTSPRGLRTITTPGFTTQITKPVEFEVIGLPGKVDPLGFSPGFTLMDSEAAKALGTKKWQGVLQIEVLSWPERKWVAKAIYDESKGWKATRVSGSREPRDSFVLRISVLKRFEPQLEFHLSYGLRTDPEAGRRKN